MDYTDVLAKLKSAGFSLDFPDIWVFSVSFSCSLSLSLSFLLPIIKMPYGTSCPNMRLFRWRYEPNTHLLSLLDRKLWNDFRACYAVTWPAGTEPSGSCKRTWLTPAHTYILILYTTMEACKHTHTCTKSLREPGEATHHDKLHVLTHAHFSHYRHG